MAGSDRAKIAAAIEQSRALGYGAPPGSGLGFAMLVGTRRAAGSGSGSGEGARAAVAA
jgi:hypothetical protein